MYESEDWEEYVIDVRWKRKTRPNNVRGGVGLCVCVGECLKRRNNNKPSFELQQKNAKYRDVTWILSRMRSVF
jgi:hypothetical protein